MKQVDTNREYRLTLPMPHAGQKGIIREHKRFNVVVCGRRWLDSPRNLLMIESVFLLVGKQF